MSKSKLKKTLKTMGREELVEMICELYDARKEAREYLEYWLDPDIDKLVDNVKTGIFKIFFRSEGNPRKSPDRTALKKLKKDFGSLCFEPEKTADIMLTEIEIYIEWLSTRKKVLSHEERIRKLFNEAYEYIDSSELTGQFGIRHDRALDRFNELMRRGDIPMRRGRMRWW